MFCTLLQTWNTTNYASVGYQCLITADFGIHCSVPRIPYNDKCTQGDSRATKAGISGWILTWLREFPALPSCNSRARKQLCLSEGCPRVQCAVIKTSHQPRRLFGGLPLAHAWPHLWELLLPWWLTTSWFLVLTASSDFILMWVKKPFCTWTKHKSNRKPVPKGLVYNMVKEINLEYEWILGWDNWEMGWLYGVSSNDNSSLARRQIWATVLYIENK